MSRWRSDPLWVCCCCCGGLGPLVILKMIFMAFPYGLAIYGWILGHAIAYFLAGVPVFIYAIVTAKQFGCVAKMLLLLFLPLPAALFFPAVIIGSTLLFLWALVPLNIEVTFDQYENPFWGMGRVWQNVWDALRDFRSEGKNLLSKVADSNQRELAAGEVPCEIPIVELVKMVFCLPFAFGVMYPLFVVLVVIKAIPFMLRLYYEMWKEYCRKSYKSWPWHCFVFPLFLIANGLVPAGLALFGVGLLFYGLLLAGYTVVVVWLSGGSARMAFCTMLATLFEFDRQTYRVIFINAGAGGEAHSFCGLCCTPGGEDALLNDEAIEFAQHLVNFARN